MPINTQIQIRKGSEDEWSSANPVLNLGEPGFDTTNITIKIGDGVTPWNDLRVGEIAHSNGNFFSTGDVKHRVFILRGCGISNEIVSLSLNGDKENPKNLEIPNNASWNFDIKIICRTKNSLHPTFAYNIIGCLQSLDNFFELLKLNIEKIYPEENSEGDLTNVSLSIVNNSLEISCSSSVGHSYWVATVDVAQIILPLDIDTDPYDCGLLEHVDLYV